MDKIINVEELLRTKDREGKECVILGKPTGMYPDRCFIKPYIGRRMYD